MAFSAERGAGHPFLKSHGAEGAPLIREADQGGTLYDSRF
jgi:hypothetical protein